MLASKDLRVAWEGHFRAVRAAILCSATAWAAPCLIPQGSPCDADQLVEPTEKPGAVDCARGA
jgi:hypothetical protein